MNTDKSKEFANLVESINPSSDYSEKTDLNPIVYITDGDSKYHKAGCDQMKNNPHPVKLSYAISQGYGECSYCYNLSKKDNLKTIPIIVVSGIIILVCAYILIKKFKH